MRRWLGVVLLCVLLAPHTRAQEAGSPEALRAAQELSAIVTADTIERLSRNMTAQVWPQIENEFGAKVDAATLGELRTEFETALTTFTASAMKDVPEIYAKYFTAAELNDLLAFYKTPTGAKALKALPQVTAEIAQKMLPRLQPFQADLVARMQAVMQRHGYKQ